MNIINPSKMSAKSTFPAAGVTPATPGRLAPVLMRTLQTLIFLLVCCGCESNKMPVFPEQITGQTPGALAPGDVVKFTFPGVAELNHSQKIRADGKVNLPLIGEVEATGKKLGDFQAELIKLYEPKLKNKDVIVTLESSTIPIYVSGAVLRPGKILLDRPMTVLEAIMEAGGFTPHLANPKKVILIRHENGKHYTQTFDLSAALKGDPSGSFFLRAYDAIYVQEKSFFY